MQIELLNCEETSAEYCVICFYCARKKKTKKVSINIVLVMT